jgi:hypothetical protein
MRFIRILLGIAGALIVGLAALIAGARFSDGPIALFPGGPLKSGELVQDPDVDWTFAKDIQEMELESDGRSRTTWLLVHERELYVPASVRFPPFKSWHLRAMEDPRAVVRIEGKRYPREFERVSDPALLEALRGIASAKYRPPPGSSRPEDVWFFHLKAPAAAS